MGVGDEQLELSLRGVRSRANLVPDNRLFPRNTIGSDVASPLPRLTPPPARNHLHNFIPRNSQNNLIYYLTFDLSTYPPGP